MYANKFTRLFILLFCLLLFFPVYTYGDSNSKEDHLPPKVNILSPYNSQQYIVSKPTIKAAFSDNHGIDINSVNLYVNYKNVTKNALIDKNSISYTPSKKFKRGTQIIRLEIEDLSNNRTSMEWYFNVGTPKYNHYYGLLHSHTSNSDGSGTYEDAYYTAKFHANLDFLAITDHSNMFDNYDLATIADGSASKKWSNLFKSSKDYNTPGNFLALKGFEMTYPYNQYDDSIGHINVFNTNGFVSTLDEYYKDNLKHFYKILSKEDYCIAQFNHPCDIFGRFNNFKYDEDADKVISLIEVCNGYNKDISKNKISFEDYQKCLDLGWHVAP
ncbi:MAG: PHP domain-containing protein, partial [Paraclostridium sp.]